MQKLKTKVCIVGGGPAGSTASLFLSKHKIQHVLLDKAVFPRNKVCGESFDGRVWHNLNRIDAQIIPEMQALGIIENSWKYSISSETMSVDINFDRNKTPRVVTHRYKFDDYLLNKAKQSEYAQIIENQTVNKTISSENFATVFSSDYEIEADFGLIASGNHSLLKNHKDPKKGIYLFTRSYYQGFKGKSDFEIEILLLKKNFNGILFIAPIGSGLYNLEVGLKKEDYKRLNISMSEVYDLALKEYPSVTQRLQNATQLEKPKGAFMNLSNSKLNLISGERFLNIGSSAITVNPITGLGVGNAMTMARHAADAIAENLEKKNKSKMVAKFYQTRVKKSLKPILRTNSIANFLSKRNVLINILLFMGSKTKFGKSYLSDHGILSKVGSLPHLFKTLYRSISTS